MKLRPGALRAIRFSTLAALLGANLLAFDARAQSQGDWIDVHFHLIADKGDLESFDEAARAALQIMDAERIRTIVVMSPPRPRENFDIESLADIVKKHGPRIVMFGGGGSLNPMLQEAGQSPEVTEGIRRRFEETAQRIIASGAKGFGEITAHHMSLSPSHGYESVPADVEKPPSLSSPRNPAVLKANLGGFERLLAHNRKAKILWAHAGADPVGYFTPRLVRELLGRHSNLALSIRPTAPFPGSMVHPKGAINDDWIALLRDFPDRFVIGSDSFVVAKAYTGAEAPRIFEQRSEIQRRGIRRLLSHLPADLARRIGYENAERLYRLNH